MPRQARIKSSTDTSCNTREINKEEIFKAGIDKNMAMPIIKGIMMYID